NIAELLAGHTVCVDNLRSLFAHRIVEEGIKRVRTIPIPPLLSGPRAGVARAARSRARGRDHRRRERNRTDTRNPMVELTRIKFLAKYAPRSARGGKRSHDLPAHEYLEVVCVKFSKLVM